MINKTAIELMIPVSKYPIVSINDTLLDAIEEMDNIQIESAGRMALPRVVLVFNHGTELVGVLRRRDIFQGLESEYLVNNPTPHQRNWFDIHIDPNLSELSVSASFHSFKKNAMRKVKDIMVPIAHTIEHSDHAMKIISLMVEYNVSIIPVTKEQRIIGVVRSADVMHYIAHEILNVDQHIKKR